MALQNTSFITAVRDYFGYKVDEKPVDFLQEIKALNTTDREYFRRLLEKTGYTFSDVT